MKGADVDNWSFDSLEDVVSRYLTVFADPEDTIEIEGSESEKENIEKSEQESEEETQERDYEEENHALADQEEADSDEDPLALDEAPQIVAKKEVNKEIEEEEKGEEETSQPQIRKESLRVIDSDEERDIIEGDVEDEIDPKFPRSFVKQLQIDQQKKRVESKKKYYFF